MNAALRIWLSGVALVAFATLGRAQELAVADAICENELVGCEGDEMPLTDAMRKEYSDLFASCTIRAERSDEVDRVIARIMKARERYVEVSKVVGAPWYVVAVIHNMECSGNFSCHLHNGDPLTRRTVQVPKGRPVAGRPPFTWEASAIDAMTYHGFDAWTDWSAAGTIFKLEVYNGMGYRKSGVPSPYLWSASQHYTRGKYVADGKFDARAVSGQIGAAVLLRRMLDQALIDAEAMRP